MTEPIQLASVRGGRDLSIQDVSLTDADLAAPLAADDPVVAGGDLAEKSFMARNAGVVAELDRRELHLARDKAKDQALLDGFEAKRKRVSGIKAKTPRKADPEFKPTLGERAYMVFFGVILRFALLIVTIAVIAMYVRSSSYSVDLSTNWWMAIAYAFPVLVASFALSSLADLSENITVKRRFAWVFTTTGMLALIVWVGCSAALFGFDTEAAQGLTLDLDLGTATTAPGQPLPAVLETLQVWVDALFPQQTIGALLLFVHVLADVLLSAAAGVFAKLAGTIGRETRFEPRADYMSYDGCVRHLRERIAQIDRQLEYTANVRQAYATGIAKARADAEARVKALELRARADQLVARSTFIETLRNTG